MLNRRIERFFSKQRSGRAPENQFLHNRKLGVITTVSLFFELCVVRCRQTNKPPVRKMGASASEPMPAQLGVYTNWEPVDGSHYHFRHQQSQNARSKRPEFEPITIREVGDPPTTRRGDIGVHAAT